MDLVGHHIGSYIVEKALGAGGTGTVYLCKHTMIERNVAVKVLHDDQARDPDQVARFFQEAKAAAEIGHPNIIVIIDFGSLKAPDGSERSWLMMEALEGKSLDKRLVKGPPLSLEDVHHIMVQCCSALTASHAKGIIHRDLKPANIFLCNRTFDPLFVKVLDFGTAKLTTPDPSIRKTQIGMVIGTPAYMSPEQCEGKGAMDHRSDIYSLGCMLYELLTGTLPFDGDIGVMLRGHLYMDIEPPSKRNPSVPPEWEALIMHMVEKAKERRPQSMVEVARALENLRSHATAYQQAAATRATAGKSGHTLIMRAEDGGSGATDSRGAERPTLHAELTAVLGNDPSVSTSGDGIPRPTEPDPSSGFPTPALTAPTVPLPDPITGPIDTSVPMDLSTPDVMPAAACRALVDDPRNGRFVATLLTRPPGRWNAIVELAATAGVQLPRGVPGPPSFVAWLDHPFQEPSACVVAFLSLQDGWSVSFLCPRRFW